MSVKFGQVEVERFLASLWPESLIYWNQILSLKWLLLFQIQLQTVGHFGLELQTCSLPRGEQENIVQSLRHQVCHHRPGSSRFTLLKSIFTLMFDKVLPSIFNNSWIVLISSEFNSWNSLLGKFSLKDTVINIVAGLGLISFITMFCDFIMLNYVSERKIVNNSSDGCSL